MPVAAATDNNQYVAMDKIDGFFMNDLGCATSHIQFYRSVYNCLKGLLRAYSVMGNPGANTPALYAIHPAKRFVHRVYGATEALMPGIVSHVAKHGAGSVFVTSAGLPNPYKNLPIGWSQLVSNVLAVK